MTGFEPVSYDHFIPSGASDCIGPDFGDTRSAGEFEAISNTSAWGSMSSEAPTPARLISNLSSASFSPVHNTIALDSATPHSRIGPAPGDFFAPFECVSVDLPGTRPGNDVAPNNDVGVFGLRGSSSHRGTDSSISEGGICSRRNQGSRPFIHHSQIPFKHLGETDTVQGSGFVEQSEAQAPGALPYSSADGRGSGASRSHSAKPSDSLGRAGEATLAVSRRGPSLSDSHTTGTQAHCGVAQQRCEVSSKTSLPVYTVLDFGVAARPPAVPRKRKRTAKSESDPSRGKRIRSEAPCVRCKLMHEKVLFHFPLSRW
jgi:hypothetical protein